MKITNKAQFERLVNIMQQNLDIARGMTKSGSDIKSDTKSRWEMIKTEININVFGPPTRDTEGWMKVWTDLKFKVKKKLARNKAKISKTGGGRKTLVVLTPLEEAVADMLNINLSVNPPGREFGETNSIIVTSVEHTNPVVVGSFPDRQEVEDDLFVAPTPVSEQNKEKNLNKKHNSEKLSTDSERLQLLKNQTKIQETLYNTVNSCLKDVINHLREVSKLSRRIYDLKKEKIKLLRKNVKMKAEKLSLYKQDLAHKQRNRSDKLKSKVQLLEMQKLQLEVQVQEREN